MLVLAMKFSSNADKQELVIEGHAPRPPKGGSRRTFTTEDRTGTGDSSACGERENLTPDECINWVSRLDTERKLCEPSGMDSLERR